MNDPVLDVFRFTPAVAPARAVVVSIPHTGTEVPDEIRRAFRTPAHARVKDSATASGALAPSRSPR